MPESTPHMSDEAIVKRIQDGDREQIGVLMERYERKLSNYGRKFLARRENIDDIVQDVFVSAYENINSFDTSLKFSSWIYRIAHNAFVNGLKKQQRSFIPDFDFDTFVTYNAPAEEPFDEKQHEEMRKMIDRGLDQLSPKYREVIILHYLEDLSYKEISDVLRIPMGTVGIRVSRGKQALKKYYEQMNVEKPYGRA